MRSGPRVEPELTPGSTGCAPRSLSTRRPRSEFHSLVWAEEVEGTRVKSENTSGQDTPRSPQHASCQDGHAGGSVSTSQFPGPRSSEPGACPASSFADAEGGQASGGGRERGAGRARKQATRMGRAAGSRYCEDDSDWAVLDDSEGEGADEDMQVGCGKVRFCF